MWYGFRFRSDGIESDPAEISPQTNHPWDGAAGGAMARGWKVLIWEDDLLLGFYGDGPEFILWIKKEN